MDFRDYAAKETAALFTRLLASQTEASVQHLRSLREAFDAATRSIEDAGTATPETMTARRIGPVFINAFPLPPDRLIRPVGRRWESFE